MYRVVFLPVWLVGGDRYLHSSWAEACSRVRERFPDAEIADDPGDAEIIGCFLGEKVIAQIEYVVAQINLGGGS